jgi:hypothetical protein
MVGLVHRRERERIFTPHSGLLDDEFALLVSAFEVFLSAAESVRFWL